MEDVINSQEEDNKNFLTSEIVNEWKKWFLSQEYSRDSAETYYSFIKRFVMINSEITKNKVDKFMSENKSCVCSSALKSFFKFLHYKKDFPNELLNLRFERTKQTKKFPKSISYNEIQIIINGIESIRDKLMTKLIYELGLRISEALELTWNKFNFNEWIANKEEWGKVNLENTKGKKFRVLPIQPWLIKEIYDNHPNRTEKGIPIGNVVFDFGIVEFLTNKKENSENIYDYLTSAENTYRKMLYKVSKQTIGKRINPHILRHSKAQHLMDKGMPIESIKEYLGHSSISSTQIYATASPEKIKKDLQEFDKKEVIVNG